MLMAHENVSKIQARILTATTKAIDRPYANGDVWPGHIAWAPLRLTSLAKLHVIAADPKLRMMAATPTPTAVSYIATQPSRRDNRRRRWSMVYNLSTSIAVSTESAPQATPSCFLVSFRKGKIK